MSEPKLSIYIAMSLDGYIATEGDGIDWLDNAPVVDEEEAKKVEAPGDSYNEFTENIKAYIVGRRTYDVVMRLTDGVFEQAQRFECYVITREDKKPENGVTFYNGDIEELVNTLKAEGKNIYCDGGGQIIKLLLEKDLIDEFIVTVVPIILGKGKPLFIGDTDTLELETYPAKNRMGYTELHYRRKR